MSLKLFFKPGPRFAAELAGVRQVLCHHPGCATLPVAQENEPSHGVPFARHASGLQMLPVSWVRLAYCSVEIYIRRRGSSRAAAAGSDVPRSCLGDA